MRCVNAARAVGCDLGGMNTGQRGFVALVASLFVALVCACGGGGGGHIQPFEALQGFVVADFDGDGRNDVAATVVLIGGAGFPGQLRLWLQRHDGSGAFDLPVDMATPAYPNQLLRTDVDGDGHADLVVASHSPACCVLDTLSWYRADPQQPGRFEPARTLAVGARISHLAAADLDGDGHTDLVVTTYGTTAGVAVAWGGVAGAFSAPVFLNSQAAAALAVGDLDGDGRPDLVYSDGSALQWLRHDAAPRAFQSAAVLASGRNPTFVVLADFDHDGLADIAYGDRDSMEMGAPGVVVLLHNDGAWPGRFAERQRQALAVHAFAAFAVDMNGDGWADLLVGEPNYRFPDVDMVEVLLGRPDASGALRSAVRSPLTLVSTYSFGVGDLDGDGRPDLLAGAMGEQQGRLAWLRQDPALPGALLAPVLLP